MPSAVPLCCWSTDLACLVGRFISMITDLYYLVHCQLGIDWDETNEMIIVVTSSSYTAQKNTNHYASHF